MRLCILVIVLLSVTSCKKDKPFGPQYKEDKGTEVDTNATHIFILNEGNFTFSNSTITDYEIETASTRQSAFQQANEESLGDVGQSMLVSGESGYLFVNNSNEVIKVSMPTLKEKVRASVQSPRYGIITSKGELWVTSLNKKDIFVLDTATLSLKRKLEASDWLEELVEVDNHVFACNVNENSVDVYSLEGRKVKTIAVGKQPQSIVLDNKGFIWVLCDGGYNPRDREKARLIQIDPITFAITYSYTFNDIEHSPVRINYNKNNGKLYFINRSVYSFSSDLSDDNPVEIFKIEGANFYGLGLDSESGTIVVTDAVDYSKRGVAYVLNTSGQFLYEFETGVIPQDVVVYH